MSKKKIAMASMMAALVVAPTLVPETAFARKHHSHRYYSQSRYNRCSGGNGAVGTIGGGVGGALIGNAVGGTVGTIAGGVGGALLGRHLDKQNTRHRNGCR